MRNDQLQAANRRQFLQGSLAAAAGGMLVSSTSGASPAPLFDQAILDQPIIDTHQHLWDLSKLRLDWLKGNETLDRSFVTKDYLAATEGLQVKRAVYMEVDVSVDQKVAEAEYVIELCKEGKSPTVAGVIGGDMTSPRFDAYIKPLAESPYIKGVRHLLHVESGGKTCLEETFVRHVRLLGKLGLRFDLCMRADQLSAGAALVKQVPETQFILDHCGNADVMAFVPESKRTRAASHDADIWRKGMTEIAKHPNIVCKLSGVIARVNKGDWKPTDLKPIIDHCIDCFGLDRVIFASDWPVCLLGAELKEWVQALYELTTPHGREAQQKFFHDNAQRVYSLS